MDAGNEDRFYEEELSFLESKGFDVNIALSSVGERRLIYRQCSDGGQARGDFARRSIDGPPAQTDGSKRREIG